VSCVAVIKWLYNQRGLPSLEEHKYIASIRRNYTLWLNPKKRGKSGKIITVYVRKRTAQSSKLNEGVK